MWWSRRRHSFAKAYSLQMETERGNAESSLRVDWAELTHECLINIFSRLSIEDRWRGAMLVCKSWLRAFKDSSFHSVLNLETHFDSPVELARWWTPEFERKIDSMLRSVTGWSASSLKEIRLRHCSDRSLALVAERCPNLEVLAIKSCPHVTDGSISRIAFSCPKLRELDISYCYEISHESLLLIGKNCPNLKVLKRNLMNWIDPSQHVGVVPDEYLNACPQDGDSDAAAIANSMPLLERLEIRFCKLSAKGFSSICQGCKKLKFIDLIGCTNLTGRDVTSAISNLECLEDIKRPNLYIPRSSYQAERYGHWRLYDERFQTDVFRS